MAQSHNDSIPQQAQLLPTKDTLTALKSDVNLVSACLELCDNALDAWQRTSNRSESAHIDIEVEEIDGRTEFIIRDNAGGVPREDAAMLFGLGQSAKGGVKGSIGTYGVGAKKSLVNLGVPFQISSRAKTENRGWAYQITEEWFEDDQDWSVPVHEKDDIDPGVTEIRIHDLNYEWDDDTAEALRKRLGEAYNLFLSDEMQGFHGTDYDLTISVCGVEVEPEGVPEWTFSPFDGLFPRRFEDIQISTPDMDDPISLHITVGLLTKKDSREAGTDIYCQKRKVASSLRNSEGGFGTSKDHLGDFSARHERLKVIVELETDGNGQMLPWDTQKSSIDEHSPVMRGTSESRGVYNWIRRTVQDYYELDADKVPSAFVEPFDAEHEHAANNGQPVQLDYSNRERVVANHRPDTDLAQVSQIESLATAHATLWISGENSLESCQMPAYRTQLSQESNRNIENLSRVDDLPPAGIVDAPHEAAGRINELARIHLEQGVYYPERLAEWELPRYREYMERHNAGEYSKPDCEPDDIPLSTGEIDIEPEPAECDDLDSEMNSDEQLGPDEQESEDTKNEESAELFLVLGGDDDDERVARLFDVSRQELCDDLGLAPDVGDETLWGELRMQFDSALTQSN